MAVQSFSTTELSHVAQVEDVPKAELETLRWLILLRYKISAALFITLSLTVLVGMFPYESAVSLGGVILTYGAATVIYNLALRGDISRRRFLFIRNLQIPEKVLICTAAIYFSGGVLTPAVVLYPLAIMEALILTGPRGVYWSGLLAITSYCLLAIAEAEQLLPYFAGVWGSQDDVFSASTYTIVTVMVSALLMVSTYMGNRVAQVISERNKQITSQLQDLRTLYDIGNNLGSIMDEDEMLRYLAGTLKSLENATSCVISLLDKEDYLQVKACAGIAPNNAARPVRIKAGVAELEPVLQRGETLVIEDIEQQPEYRPLPANPGTRSAYIFPIKVESKVVGIISLAYDKPTHRGSEYTSLLNTVAIQAGLAIQRANLFSSTQRLAREMSALHDIGLYTGSTLSYDEVIRRTAATLEKLLSPDAYYIALYNAESNIISFEVFIECGQPMPKMKTSLAKGGLTARIVESGKPLLVQDWLTEGQQYDAVANKTGADMLSYLGVPMIIEDKVVGVISVQSQQPLAFDTQHERMLSSLAAQAAMALENARLHRLAQDQACLDSLTKAYNHGHFVDLARKAVENSDRDDSCVALIMLDIDHFKQYNDTYGHVAGDNVLRMVAGALKSSVRETDFVGRWGGEEFCVLLPGAGVQEAKKISRYIRRAIAELYPVDGRGQLIPNPTVSQGISCYPYPSASASELIEEADAALYQAKKRGRNQLVVYEAKGVLKEATTTTGHLSVKILLKDPSLARAASTVTTDNLLAAMMHIAPEHPNRATTPRLS